MAARNRIDKHQRVTRVVNLRLAQQQSLDGNSNKRPMSVLYPSNPSSSKDVAQQTQGRDADGTLTQITDVLNTFDGERSLKRLFWELLSYERVREELPLSLLPDSALEFMTGLEVFART